MTLSPISDSTEADARRRFDELPSFDEPGWGIDSRTDLNTAPPTRAKRARPMPRRSFIKLLGGGAVAVGLTVVGWLPPLRLRRADALYNEWSDCHNFFDETTVCTPQSWWITGSSRLSFKHQCSTRAKARSWVPINSPPGDPSSAGSGPSNRRSASRRPAVARSSPSQGHWPLMRPAQRRPRPVPGDAARRAAVRRESGCTAAASCPTGRR